MPGPVSDSYDPEFGTAANAAVVEKAIREAKQRITDIIGSGDLQNIIDVCSGPNGPKWSAQFTEREWLIIRFAMNMALQSM